MNVGYLPRERNLGAFIAAVERKSNIYKRTFRLPLPAVEIGKNLALLSFYLISKLV